MSEQALRIAAAVAAACGWAGVSAAQDQPPAQEPVAEAATENLPKSFFSGWTGSVAAGVNGSGGNTERFNVRAGLEAARSTDRMDTKFLSVLSYGVDDGDKSENRWLNELRNDWKFEGSRWRFFALGRLEHDDFQDWNWRASAFAGPGYELIKNDKTFLLARAGVGVTREIGGSENRVIPELDIGADYEHKFTDTQKITATADYYPDLGEFPGYRFVGRAAYEVLVDPASKMSLKLGIEDRYDSTPGDGKHRNDIDYFLLLSWAF